MKEEEKRAKEYFNIAVLAMYKKDYDKAVRNFFKASRADFGNKKYHEAFADSLLKRGLTPLDKENASKAEELYQSAKKTRDMTRYDMRIEAALLGHLDAAYDLRNDFVIAVMTTPEGKVLTDLLVKMNHPQTMCKAAFNYSCGMGGYPLDKNKAMELYQKAADLGYEEAAKIIENIKRNEKEEKERVIAEEKFAKKNPPLKGEERKKCEEELANELRALSRKATFFKPEKCKTPLPMKQMLSSHIGGVPYFEKGGNWPCNENGDPMQFIFQIFQDSGGSIALPECVKLLQLFYDFEKEEGHVTIYRELNTENAVLIDFPYVSNDDNENEEEEFNEDDYDYMENSIGYMVLSFENADIVHEAYYLNRDFHEAAAIADKIHPHKGEFVIKKLCKDLGLKEPCTESYLGGYFANMSNSWAPDINDKDSTPLFQLYLENDGDGPYGWRNWYDAMIYAVYNNKTKDVSIILDIDYD
ncbi:MAG: YwqG family protein [Treponema sp.]|nr:YwqG family protein [Treponema sp.]